MIPAEIEALTVVVQIAIGVDWRFQLISTNWSGYWIIQLQSKTQEPQVFLLDLEQLRALCEGLKTSIDAAIGRTSWPNAKAMSSTIAEHLRTHTNDDGAVTIQAFWHADPTVVLCYFRRNSTSNDAVIRHALHARDAMVLYNNLVRVYNSYPDKALWKRRAATGGQVSRTAAGFKGRIMEIFQQGLNSNKKAEMDTSTRALQKLVDYDGAKGRKRICLSPPARCDLCHRSLAADRFMVDGEITGGSQTALSVGHTMGQWGFMCANCFMSRGVGIKWGSGQLYERNNAGDWVLVAGFDPDEELDD